MPKCCFSGGSRCERQWEGLCILLNNLLPTILSTILSLCGQFRSIAVTSASWSNRTLSSTKDIPSNWCMTLVWPCRAPAAYGSVESVCNRSYVCFCLKPLYDNTWQTIVHYTQQTGLHAVHLHKLNNKKICFVSTTRYDTNEYAIKSIEWCSQTYGKVTRVLQNVQRATTCQKSVCGKERRKMCLLSG